MEPEETIAALLSKSEQVAEENDHLKAVLCSVVLENRELRGRTRSSNNSRMYSLNDTRDELRGGVVPPPRR